MYSTQYQTIVIQSTLSDIWFLSCLVWSFHVNIFHQKTANLSFIFGNLYFEDLNLVVQILLGGRVFQLSTVQTIQQIKPFATFRTSSLIQIQRFQYFCKGHQEEHCINKKKDWVTFSFNENVFVWQTHIFSERNLCNIDN